MIWPLWDRSEPKEHGMLRRKINIAFILSVGLICGFFSSQIWQAIQATCNL